MLNQAVRGNKKRATEGYSLAKMHKFKLVSQLILDKKSNLFTTLNFYGSSGELISYQESIHVSGPIGISKVFFCSCNSHATIRFSYDTIRFL